MNIATALKAEISRLARKEVRTETQSLSKASTKYRSDIAALKREIAGLQRDLKALQKTGKRPASPAEAQSGDESQRLRFRAAGFAKHRQRLGLSAEQMGALVGVTGQTIYKWESSKGQPRRSQLPAIAAVRAMGKREAMATLTGGDTVNNG